MLPFWNCDKNISDSINTFTFQVPQMVICTHGGHAPTKCLCNSLLSLCLKKFKLKIPLDSESDVIKDVCPQETLKI